MNHHEKAEECEIQEGLGQKGGEFTLIGYRENKSNMTEAKENA
jgi:hypothetical protein